MKNHLSRILKPEQIKRVEQIRLQSAGAMTIPPCSGVLSYPETQKALKLSDKQKGQIKAIDDGAQKEWEAVCRELIRTDGAVVQGNSWMHRVRVHKAALEKAVKVLTEDQLKVWKELAGEPWDSALILNDKEPNR
jgi:hypothetical protein